VSEQAGFETHRILLTVCAALAVLLASNSVFLLSEWCGRFLAFLMLSLVLLAAWREWTLSRWWRLPFLLGCLALAFAAVGVDSNPLRTVILAWLLLVARLAGDLPGRGSPTFGSTSILLQLHWGCLGFACFQLCYERSHRLWFLIGAINRALSPSSPVGTWVSGFPIYVFGLLVILPLAIIGRGRRRAAISAALLSGAWALGVFLVSFWAPTTGPKISILHAAALVVVALSVSYVSRHRSITLRTLVSSGLISAGLLALIMTVISGSSRRRVGVPQEIMARPSIGLYSEGLYDLGVPDCEHLGLVNSGMFGLLRQVLQDRLGTAQGEVILTDSLKAEVLSRVRCMVFINPVRRPAPVELQGLRTFVSSGGSLLVLGDHTDIAGSRGPLNAILGFTGIRFNFDSAMALRQHWQGCLEIRDRTLARGLAGEVMLQIAVGASLDVSAPAVPLVVARFGFADRGDALNGGRGAYMGDGRHQRGEAVGDLVLVAGQQVGRGKVLVLGDTSPFQNGALLASQRFVSNAMAWLEGCDDLAKIGESRDSLLKPGCDVALLDFSLRPRASLELFTDRSLGGLANCLARSHVTAVPALSSEQWVPEAAFLFIVSPARSPRAEEAVWLLDYMASGNHVVFSQGFVSPQPCRKLLASLGFELEPIPLGGGDEDSRVSHRAAWAMAYHDTADTTVWATAFTYPTIVTRRFGRGSFTLISDGQFLLDANLESERSGDPKNIDFLADLIEYLRGQEGYVISSHH
jgi:hypothetical protein